MMISDSEITADDLNGIYKEIANIIGIENTLLLYRSFQGQQINFPKKFYAKEYIIKQARENEKNEKMRSIAFKFGYTENHLRKILKDNTDT